MECVLFAESNIGAVSVSDFKVLCSYHSIGDAFFSVWPTGYQTSSQRYTDCKAQTRTGINILL